MKYPLGILILVSCVIVFAGCGEKSSKAATEEPTSTVEAAGEHEEAEGAAPAPDEPCEHNIPIYTCDECRYECGAVKVVDSLVSSGLVRFDSAQEGVDGADLQFSGILALDDDRTARIAAPCEGNLAGISAELGSTVGANGLVFTMRSAEYEQTAAEFIRAKNAEEVATAAWLRDSALAAVKALSDRDAAESKTACLDAAAQLRASERSLSAFGLTATDLSMLSSGESKDLLSVRTPVGGTVIERSGARGERLTTERVVATVSDLGKLWAWFDLYEKDIARLEQARKAGPLRVSLMCTAWQGRRFSGTIDWIGAEINPQTRTVRVRATIDNAGGELRAGMYCNASVKAPTVPGARVVVPAQAVQSDAGRDFVFVPYVKGYCLRRFVETLPANGDQRTILAGLAVGERIVTDGAFLLKSDVLRDKMGAGCAD